MDFLIDQIQWVAAYAHIWGFLIVFILMAVESSLIPFPSEVTLIPAGFLAYRGALSFGDPIIDCIIVIIVATIGSVVGAYFNYYLALFLGRPILYKYGKYFFIKKQVLERSEEVFNDYGDIATFVCRLLPAIRQLISLPAGIARMPIWRFTFFTALGAAIWSAILTFIGYYLGTLSKNMSYRDMVYKGKDILSKDFIWIILGLVIIIVVYLLVSHFVMKSSKKLNES